MSAARVRIQLAVPLRDWVEKALDVPGIRLAPLDATARTRGMALATRDERIIEYARFGFLRVVEL